MFVSKSKHLACVRDLQDTRRTLAKFVHIATYQQQLLQQCQPQFSPAEIETLIRLCHPDKHNNSVTSNVITTKLIGMRKCKKPVSTNG